MKDFEKLLKKEKIQSTEVSTLSYVQGLYQQAKKWLRVKHSVFDPATMAKIASYYGNWLTQILAAENVPVFTVASVEQYQEEVRQHGRQNKAKKALRKKNNRRTLFFYLIFSIGLVLLSLHSLVFLIVEAETVITVLAFILIIFGIFGSMISLLKKPGYCFWQRLSISQYNDIIPPDVLEVALRLKKKLPGIYFWLEHFTCDGYTRCSDTKLFLIIAYGDKEYYLAVE